MGTIQSSALLPRAVNLMPRPAIKNLESRIAEMKGEMDFYHQLLCWLLFSCQEDKRHIIEALRAEVMEVRDGGFSALLDGLERLKGEMKGTVTEPGIYSDIAWLQVYLKQIEGTLQALKSRIHRSFGDYTHVRIW